MKTRKVFRIGHSLAVTLPGGMVRSLGIREGQMVEIILLGASLMVVPRPCEEKSVLGFRRLDLGKGKKVKHERDKSRESL